MSLLSSSCPNSWKHDCLIQLLAWSIIIMRGGRICKILSKYVAMLYICPDLQYMLSAVVYQDHILHGLWCSPVTFPYWKTSDCEWYSINQIEKTTLFATLIQSNIIPCNNAIMCYGNDAHTMLINPNDNHSTMTIGDF